MNPHRTLLLPGLGNTGSHLAPLVARMGLADRLVLCDFDLVEAGNMPAQAHRPESVGQPKVLGMADRLEGLNPALEVELFIGELEDLPLGYFSGMVALCLHQDGARQVAGERTWMMGGTLLDVAVNGQAGLARVTRIVPEAGRACLQCGWSDSQYANLPVRHSCRKTAPTNAPAALGSFAASLAAVQIQSPAPAVNNIEIISSPRTGEMWLSTLTANPNCRFRHEAPSIGRLDAIDPSAPLATLFECLETNAIELPGFSFNGHGRCVACDLEIDLLVVNRRTATRGGCRRCGGVIEFPAFHRRSQIKVSALNEDQRTTGIEAIGLRDGDVIRADQNRWMQLGLNPSNTPIPSSHA